MWGETYTWTSGVDFDSSDTDGNCTYGWFSIVSPFNGIINSLRLQMGTGHSDRKDTYLAISTNLKSATSGLTASDFVVISTNTCGTSNWDVTMNFSDAQLAGGTTYYCYFLQAVDGGTYKTVSNRFFVKTDQTVDRMHMNNIGQTSTAKTQWVIPVECTMTLKDGSYYRIQGIWPTDIVPCWLYSNSSQENKLSKIKVSDKGTPAVTEDRYVWKTTIDGGIKIQNVGNSHYIPTFTSGNSNGNGVDYLSAEDASGAVVFAIDDRVNYGLMGRVSLKTQYNSNDTWLNTYTNQDNFVGCFNTAHAGDVLLFKQVNKVTFSTAVAINDGDAVSTIYVACDGSDSFTLPAGYTYTFGGTTYVTAASAAAAIAAAGTDDISVTVSPVITDLNNLSNDRAYVIYNARGIWNFADDATSMNTVTLDNMDLNNEQQQIALICHKENYYLYSVNVGKYLTADNALTSTPTDNEQISIEATSNESYPWIFRFKNYIEDDHYTKYINTSDEEELDNKIKIDGYGPNGNVYDGQIDDGNRNAIIDVAAFDATDALDMFKVDIAYTLTDENGAMYNGTYREEWEGDDTPEPSIPGADGITFSDKVFSDEGGDYSFVANITFPFPVSSNTTTKYTYIGSFNNPAYYWYAMDNDGIWVKKDDVPYNTNYENYDWSIEPTLSNNAFTFKIKNRATGTYVTSTSSENSYEAGVVTLTAEGTSLTYINSDGNCRWLLPTEKQLSVNSSSETAAQRLGTWNQHNGSAIGIFERSDFETLIANFVAAAIVYAPYDALLGDGVGQYSGSTMTQMHGVYMTSQSGSAAFTAAALAANTETLANPADKLTLNQPTTGYYQIKSKFNEATGYYLSCENKDDGSDSNAKLTTSTDEKNIFYIEVGNENSTIKSYSTGFYFGSGTRANFTEVVETPIKWTFSEGINKGTYTLTSNASAYYSKSYSEILYGWSGKSSKEYTDRNSAIDGDGHTDWILEPVAAEDMPVIVAPGSTETEVGIQGYITSIEDHITANITEKILSLNLSNATFGPDVNIDDIKEAVDEVKGNDKDVLVEVAKGTTVAPTTTNVIVRTDTYNTYNCNDLQLNDNNIPLFGTKRITFEDTNVTYTRGTSANIWGTICLPYATSTEGDIQYYRLADSDNGNIRFTKVTESTTTANEPYLIKKGAGAGFAVSAEAQDFMVGVGGAQSSGEHNGYKMQGTLAAISVLDGDTYTTPKVGYAGIVDANAYYFDAAENKFRKLNGRFNLKAFRAYLTAVDPDPSRQAILGIDYDEDGEATGISFVESADGNTVDVIFDLNGRRLQNAKKGINIINGRKVIK